MNILVMVLDLMHVHNLHCQLVNGVISLLTLMWTIAHQHILLIKKKDHLILGEVSTYGLEDTKLTTQAKYPVKIIKARKNIVSVYTTMQPTVCCMLMM